MIEILLVSDGIFHPPFGARRVVRNVITAVSNHQITQIRHLNELTRFDLSRFQALVLYYHHKQLAAESLQALEQYVKNGGNMLAIHSATASFKQQNRYFEILGGRFTGHGPVEPFDIHPTTVDDEVFVGIGPFSVTDELYLHDLQPDIRIHFETTFQEKSEPMVWTHKAGNGRICYICPGHRTATMKQPEIQEILRKGLKWVLGE